MFDTTSLIRKLAKGDKYQSLFSYAKDLRFKLFLNEEDLTEIQIMFLRYLTFYSSIYMDIALGDVDDRVLENDIYEDAYVMYRNKNLSNAKEARSKHKVDKEEKPRQNIQWLFKTEKK
jgi:hypothetical protein